MRDGWEVVPLGHLADTQLGKALPRGGASDPDGFPYLRNANVQWGQVDVSDLRTMPFSADDRSRLSLMSGDILVCEGGEAGRLAVLGRSLEGIYFQNAIHRVRVDRRRAIPAFVACALEQLVKAGGLEGLVSQITIAHLNQAKLRGLPVPLPSLAEQRRIVDLIAAVDDAIHAASDVRRELFIARSKWWDSAAHTDKSTVVGDLIAAIQAGKSPPAQDRVPGDSEKGVLKVSSVQADGFRPHESKVLDSGHELFEDRHVVRKHDVLITRANTPQLVGLTCLVQHDHPNLFLCDKTLRLVPRPGVAPESLVAALNSGEARTQIEDLATGTSASMKNISQAKIRKIRLRWPSDNSRASALGVVDQAMLEILAQLRTSESQLRDLRSEMLTVLLSGEHEIPESYDALLEKMTA